MSTFNFTVRATDDQDAYADRKFSINVKNDKMVNCVIADGTNVYTTTNLGKDTMVTRPGVTTETINWTMNTLTYGNGTWIASNSSNYYTSNDGINWAKQTYPDYTSTTFKKDSQHDNDGHPYPLNNITFKNGYFFVVLCQKDTYSDYFNYVLYSVDGINWKQFGTTCIINTNITIPTNDFYFDGKDLFIAMSTTGYYRTTTDSSGNKTWKNETVTSLSGSTITAIGITCINGLWLLYSASSLFTSNDLATWTARSGFSGNTELKYVNGRVVSLLDNTGGFGPNNFFYSQDCITWASAVSLQVYTSNIGRACMYKGSFIMVASTGSILSSSDGVNYSAMTQLSGAWPFSDTNGIASIV